MIEQHLHATLPSSDEDPRQAASQADRLEAQRLYEAGNAERKLGHWAEAQNLYEQAVALDASSPAAAARQMLEDIMAYRCKDYYNP